MQAKYLLRDNEPSAPLRIDSYPASPLARHCINALTTGWSGTIRILASIELVPTDDDWFEVVREDVVGKRFDTKNLMWVVPGCLIWMKAELVNDAGTGRIDRITAL